MPLPGRQAAVSSRFTPRMKVASVETGSPAERAGIRVDDDLRSVGGTPVADAIDLTVAIEWADDDSAEYEFRRGSDTFSATLPVVSPEELGIVFEQDATRVCGNNCLFCFVDQLPPGLRPSLYVKDEDYRLSFTFGNYITLTNLSESDYERIDRLRLSPLYVSVHATDDGVRRKMLGNGNAPAVIPALERLGRSGIRLHTQVVLCPGLNDGEVLERTLGDLFRLGATIESIAVVPVGLTEHRAGLYPLRALNPGEAASALRTIERWQEEYLRGGGERTVYAADELYLLAREELPPLAHYDALPQIENGVGLLRVFESDLVRSAARLAGVLERQLSVAVVTGRLAGPFIESVLRSTLGALPGLRISVEEIDNSLLGNGVTVAGLLPGRAMVDAVRAAETAHLILLPAVAFNQDGLTMDGMTASQIAEAAGREPNEVVPAEDIVGEILRYVGGEPRSTSDRGAHGKRG